MSGNRSSKAAVDNRANQLNPQHAAYHESRGTPHGAAVVTADHVRASNEAKDAESGSSPAPSNNSANSGK